MQKLRKLPSVPFRILCFKFHNLIHFVEFLKNIFPFDDMEEIIIEYDAFSSVEIVLGFFKIKDLYKSYYYRLPVLVP